MPYYFDEAIRDQRLKKEANAFAMSRTSNRIVLIGNSLIANNNVSGHRSDRGAFTWCNIFMGQSWDVLANLGIGGQRSDQILARFNDALAYKPDAIYLDALTNDVSQQASNNASNTVEKSFSNITTMIQRGLRKGIRMIVPTMPPSASWTTTAQTEMFFKLNSMLMEYGRNTPGLIVVDIGGVLAGPTGLTLADGYAVDTTHPSALGACKQGRLLANRLAEITVHKPAPFNTSKGDIYNMTGNGGMVGSTGTATGTATGQVADTWIAAGYGAGTLTCSKVARSDGRPGEMQRLVFAGGDASSSFDFYKDIVAGPTTFQPGDTVYVEMLVRYDQASVLGQGIIAGGISRVNTGSVTLDTKNALHHESNNPNLTIPPEGFMTLRTDNFVVAPTADRLRTLIKTYALSATLDVLYITVRKA